MRKLLHARKWSHVTIYIPECFVVNTRELPVSACPHSQGVGVLLSLLSASLFEHVSMGQARNPPTLWTTLCVYPVLARPPWPWNHRICAIAKETGLSPLAGTCSGTWGISSAPPHLGAAFLLLTPFTSENHDPTNWR